MASNASSMHEQTGSLAGANGKRHLRPRNHVWQYKVVSNDQFYDQKQVGFIAKRCLLSSIKHAMCNNGHTSVSQRDITCGGTFASLHGPKSLPASSEADEDRLSDKSKERNSGKSSAQASARSASCACRLQCGTRRPYASSCRRVDCIEPMLSMLCRVFSFCNRREAAR